MRSVLRYCQCSATLPPPRGRGGNRAGFRSRCWAGRWAGVCKTSQLCPGSRSRATPHLLAEISPATRLGFLQLKAVGGSMGSCSAVHTSFQSLTSHGLGTGTIITVAGVTRRESAARGLLASLHSPLTPSSHLCLMPSLLWATEVQTHVLGQFYLAEPSGS